MFGFYMNIIAYWHYHQLGIAVKCMAFLELLYEYIQYIGITISLELQINVWILYVVKLQLELPSAWQAKLMAYLHIPVICT
jgi:hypothetical protein